VFGPVYYQLLLSGQLLAADFAERVVDAVLPAFFPSLTEQADDTKNETDKLRENLQPDQGVTPVMPGLASEAGVEAVVNERSEGYADLLRQRPAPGLS
jgi:hypothetical protein